MRFIDPEYASVLREAYCGPQDSECQWFQWIGAPGCDNCGRKPMEHKGIAKLKSGPFTMPPVWDHVLWEDL